MKLESTEGEKPKRKSMVLTTRAKEKIKNQRRTPNARVKSQEFLLSEGKVFGSSGINFCCGMNFKEFCDLGFLRSSGNHCSIDFFFGGGGKFLGVLGFFH